MNVLQIAAGFTFGILIGKAIIDAVDSIHDTHRRRTP